MSEPFYTSMLQALHVGGGWLAFGAAPIALLALKGSRRHVWAGRCFLLALTIGITAGLVLATIDGAIGLFFFGLLTLFLLGTGYLAPRIGRGSRSCYRWDRALTAVGAIGTLGLIRDGLIGNTSPWEGLSFGGLGLAIVVAHGRWRGPPRPVALASGTSHEPARGVYRRLELHPRPVRWAAECHGPRGSRARPRSHLVGSPTLSARRPGSQSRH